MENSRFNDNLLSLPLFLGMSRNDLQEVVGHTKFDFHKYAGGETIVSEGTPCRHIHFLMSGSVCIITEANDHGYQIEEEICAPELFQPENIFGLTQRYTHTFVAKKNCGVMRLDKKETMKLFDEYKIFRLNMLNQIATQNQKLNRHILKAAPKTLEERITRFFEQRCMRPAGKKTFRIKMTRIAEEVNDSRLDVSKALNRMEGEGLIKLFRARIQIPALEKLINYKF